MPLSKFAQWFCLKEDRTFMVQPDQDPQFYFGRSELAESITDKLERGILLQRVPKMVIYGAFGAGKTHTLHHIRWYLEQHDTLKFEVRYVETPPDLHKKSRYLELHQAMMEKIGLATVRRLLEAFITNNLGAGLNEKLLEHFFQDEDFVTIVKVIANPGPQQLVAWRWLRGETLPEAQLGNIGVARNPDLKDLINILVMIGRLLFELDERRLVFLIDELDLLEYVTGEEISTWETAFRKLADQDNRFVGFVMASRGPGGDELPRPLRYQAFTTRIKETNFVEIPFLNGVEDVVAFVRELVAHLVDLPCAERRLRDEGLDSPLDLYPFTPEALELINQYITEDPTRSLPRELLFSLNECGAAAVKRESVLISEDIVSEVLL